MAIITRNELRSKAVGYVGSNRLKGGVINESRKFTRTQSKTSVFLSHSHKDKDVVEQAKILFENIGVNIYVDWQDETMPQTTNGVTATKIKSKIMTNDKFVFLATNNAVVSRWCNWEVGVGDTFKFSKDNLVILGLADNNKTWNGNEYLQIYPRIEENPTTDGRKHYFVWYPNGSYVTLIDWLRK